MWDFDYHDDLFAQEGFCVHRNKMYAVLYGIQRGHSLNHVHSNSPEPRLRFWQREYKKEHSPQFGFRDRGFWFCHVKKEIVDFDAKRLNHRVFPVNYEWRLQYWKDEYKRFSKEKHRRVHKCKLADSLHTIRERGGFHANLAHVVYHFVTHQERRDRHQFEFKYEREFLRENVQYVNMQVHRHGRCMSEIEHGARDCLNDCENYKLKLVQDGEARLRQWKIAMIQERLDYLKEQKFGSIIEYLKDAHNSALYLLGCAEEAAEKAKVFKLNWVNLNNFDYVRRAHDRWQWHIQNGTTLSERGIQTHNSMVYLKKSQLFWGK